MAEITSKIIKMLERQLNMCSHDDEHELGIAYGLSLAINIVKIAENNYMSMLLKDMEQENNINNER